VKTLIRTVVIVVVLGAALWAAGAWFKSRAAVAADQPKAVRVEPAVRGTLVEFVSSSGDVEPRTRVSISARVSARISELPFKEGDRVTKGNPDANPPVPPSVLVRLDSKDLEAQLRSVEARSAAEKASLKVADTRVSAQKARIEALKIMLEDAKRELKRQSKLLASSDVSQAAVDTLQTKVSQQEAEMLGAVASLKGEEGGLIVLKHNIDAAEAEIAKARDNLTYATITSPIDGVVTRMNAEVGEVAMMGTMNNAGTMIMEVADLSEMILKAKVDENAIADVKVGQKAKVRMEAYRDRVFDGVVRNVALANFDASLARGSAGSNRNFGSDGGKSFKVEVLIDTQGLRIFSGLSGDVDIETRRHDGVIKVPSQAVLGRELDKLPTEMRNLPEVDVTKANIPVVYRHVNGETVVTPVTIGASDLTHTIIKSGLDEGDVVVTGPYKALEGLDHKQKIKPEQPATRPATTTATTTATSKPATTRSTTTTPTTTQPLKDVPRAVDNPNIKKIPLH
jgi:HlyD family secretion protein